MNRIPVLGVSLRYHSERLCGDLTADMRLRRSGSLVTSTFGPIRTIGLGISNQYQQANLFSGQYLQYYYQLQSRLNRLQAQTIFLAQFSSIQMKTTAHGFLDHPKLLPASDS